MYQSELREIWKEKGRQEVKTQIGYVVEAIDLSGSPPQEKWIRLKKQLDALEVMW